MGFFDKIKGAVGIGQPKLELSLEGNQVKRGETLNGSFTMTGGSRALPVDKFVIEHVEVHTRREWSNTTKNYVDRKVRNTVNKIEITKGGAEIQPGETMEESFELPVSSSAMPSGHPYAHELKVSADVPGLDPNKKVEIFVL